MTYGDLAELGDRQRRDWPTGPGLSVRTRRVPWVANLVAIVGA
jgi:hypothetical protein